MQMVTPARRELLRRPSSPHTMKADNTAKEREPETEGGTDQGSQDAVARCGDGGAEVRLQHNDGADGSPVAVPEAESQRDPPAESSGQGGSRGVDQKPLALPVQQALRSNSIDAQFNGELLLRPRFGFR
jgi:hypothetical protein